MRNGTVHALERAARVTSRQHLSLSVTALLPVPMRVLAGDAAAPYLAGVTVESPFWGDTTLSRDNEAALPASPQDVQAIVAACQA